MKKQNKTNVLFTNSSISESVECRFGCKWQQIVAQLLIWDRWQVHHYLCFKHTRIIMNTDMTCRVRTLIYIHAHAIYNMLHAGESSSLMRHVWFLNADPDWSNTLSTCGKRSPLRTWASGWIITPSLFMLRGEYSLAVSAFIEIIIIRSWPH